MHTADIDFVEKIKQQQAKKQSVYGMSCISSLAEMNSSRRQIKHEGWAKRKRKNTSSKSEELG